MREQDWTLKEEDEDDTQNSKSPFCNPMEKLTRWFSYHVEEGTQWPWETGMQQHSVATKSGGVVLGPVAALGQKVARRWGRMAVKHSLCKTVTEFMIPSDEELDCCLL
jgi:hypothetical protein